MPAFAYTNRELVGAKTPSVDLAGQARWSIGQEWDSGGTGTVHFDDIRLVP